MRKCNTAFSIIESSPKEFHFTKLINVKIITTHLRVNNKFNNKGIKRVHF